MQMIKLNHLPLPTMLSKKLISALQGNSQSPGDGLGDKPKHGKGNFQETHNWHWWGKKGKTSGKEKGKGKGKDLEKKFQHPKKGKAKSKKGWPTSPHAGSKGKGKGTKNCTPSKNGKDNFKNKGKGYAGRKG